MGKSNNPKNGDVNRAPEWQNASSCYTNITGKSIEGLKRRILPKIENDLQCHSHLKGVCVCGGGRVGGRVPRIKVEKYDKAHRKRGPGVPGHVDSSVTKS